MARPVTLDAMSTAPSGSPGLRSQVETASRPLLAALHRQPRPLIPIATVVLVLVGLLAPLPVALTRQYLSAGLDAALDWERDTQSALFQTADHAEGKAAFLGKRPPAFNGV